MSRLRVLLVLGTRPEAIKMAPVIHECRRRPGLIEPVVCSTGQHSEMLTQVLSYFNIQVDEDLGVMTANQSLAQLTARCLERIDQSLTRWQPHCVVAQGDTTTALAASMAAFYRHIPFVHVEAGLRTGNLQSPWPEELNRRIADLTTTLYCAPTQRAVDALVREGVSLAAIRLTGNTVIDALLTAVSHERRCADQWQAKYPMLNGGPMVLITGHRRESFGRGFEEICRAIGLLADRFTGCQFVFPVHLNPNVRGPVYGLLSGRANVHLVPPVAYPEFVWLMDRSTLILTDSGGVQEEAPTLRKPVVVMRETTERPEAVEAGIARLTGASCEGIVSAVALLLTNPAAYAACQADNNPFGDGHAAERIVDWILEQGWA